MIGKMCSSYGIFSVYVVGMEVFPTTSRNSLVNIANTVGRIGSVIAPQTPLLVIDYFSHFIVKEYLEVWLILRIWWFMYPLALSLQIEVELENNCNTDDRLCEDSFKIEEGL